MANEDIKEIESISFGIYSREEILNMSVCKLTNSKRNGDEYGTVYDRRMGTTDSKKDCDTCHEDPQLCPGHFGHIEFNEPIIHPLYYKQVVSFLRCFCTKCHKLLIEKDHIYISELNRYKGNKRFTKILEKLEKVDICCQPKDGGEEDENGEISICGNNQPQIKFSSNDNTISMMYEYSGKIKTSVNMSVEDIMKIFDDISDEDVELLGFNPKLIHPRNFIISVLPVLPPCDRPYVKADGNICDDDLTNQYIEIIKANNNLENPASELKKQKNIQTLKFRVLTMFNNSKGKAKHTTNGRPIKGIKERLTGKEGQIRNNMMGKRVNQSARTVIGPDPTLKMGQLAVPRDMAKILSVPVKVTKFNYDILSKIVNDGKANYIKKYPTMVNINLKRALYFRGTKLLTGDIIHRGEEQIPVSTGKEVLENGDKIFRDGKFLENIEYPARKTYKLQIGDIVERQLQNGDYVLLNRQPTLHKGSMMSMEVIVRDHKTLRMNLAITKAFNADFDTMLISKF